MTFPLSQIAENTVPFDFVFLEQSTCKMFGLQYKALYRNGQDHWPLSQLQHERLRAFHDWGYYCLSEVTSPMDYKIAIHRARFVPVSLNFEPRLYANRLDMRYYRWGGFIAGLEGCTVGRRVATRQDVEQALRPADRDYIEEVDRYLVDVFLANLQERRLLHLDDRL